MAWMINQTVGKLNSKINYPINPISNSCFSVIAGLSSSVNVGIKNSTSVKNDLLGKLLYMTVASEL